MPEPFEAAVREYWYRREEQAVRQVEAGRTDAGRRGEITGGRHLDPLRDLLAELFIQEGFSEESVLTGSRISIPGYYRPTKDWDLLVIEDDLLVAAIELKSQVGPSFGNNVNNRSEEAIGNAVDVWRAYEEGTFGPIRPWLGYVFLLEEADGSTSPVRIRNTLFPVEPVFEDSSYLDRYRILCDRLVKERLYDAAWFVTSSADPRSPINEPDPGLSFAQFAASIRGRAAYIQALY